MASRLLLPFTSGVDSQAITYAVQLARSQNAILVPFSLIRHQAGKTPYAVRLEHVQQSQDFLGMVRTIATRFHVPVECYECYTSDIVASITQMSNELACESDIVVMSTRKTFLMQTKEAQTLLQQAEISHMVLQVPQRPQRHGAVRLEQIIKSLQQHNAVPVNELMTSS